MKIVLTCGHPFSGYHLAHNALAAAGLTQAKPSRHERMSPAEMHQKICKAYGLDLLGAGPVGQLSPGKVWQNLAVDLLMGNLDGESWGWGDGNMVGLLEFWRDFDPQIRFVLVYSEPSFAVGQMLRNGLWGHTDIRRAVASWEASNAELLRFYHRNADRCLLVNVAVAIHAPADLVEKADNTFGLGIGSLGPDYRVDWMGLSALAPSLAKGLMEGCEAAEALYLELESSADLDGSAVSLQEEGKPHVWSELARLFADLEQASEQARLAEERQALLAQAAEVGEEQARQVAELRQEVERLSHACDGQAALVTELHARLEQMAEARDEQARLAEERQALSEYATEVCEDLDRQVIELRSEVERLARDYDEQARLAEERQVKLEEVDNSLSAAQAETALTHSKSIEIGLENERLLVHLNQIQEENESRYLKLQAYAGIEQSLALAQEKIVAGEASLAGLQKQIEQLGKARDELAKLAAERQARLEQAAKASEQQARLAAERQKQIERLTKEREEQAKLAVEQLRSGEAKLAPLEQENEFLLLQLHQVQGELEHYFLLYQDLADKGGRGQVMPGMRAGYGCQPAEVVFDLRSGFHGDNWYEAEHDGRWAGPQETSTIKLLPLPGGQYEAQFDVVDAMDPEILLGMELSLNGQPLRLNDDWEGFPATLHARFDTGQLAGSPLWEFQLKFPKLVSPAENGSDDRRRLAIRMRSVRLSAID